MDSTQVLVVVFASIWILGGLVVALWMRRSGHSLYIWLGIGVLCGPFSALLALDRIRHLPRPSPLPIATDHGDVLDVVVGIDGSPESVLAAKTALALLSDRITSLTLATVLDYDSSGLYSGAERQAAAYERLRDTAAELGFEPVETELLFGQPAKALVSFAEEAGFELLVVGPRGRGLSKALVGSVSSALLSDSPIPVLVGPTAQPGHPPSGEPNEVS